MNKCIKIIIVSIMCCFLTACSTEGSKQEDIIGKLGEFTTMSESEDKYVFSYLDSSGQYHDWKLLYSKENEFVRIADYRLNDTFINYFGEDCLDLDLGSTISYDFSDNEARIYFNEDIAGISILNYNLDKEEFYVNANGEHYYIKDEFESFLKEKYVVDYIQESVDSFKSCLENHGIDFNAIKNLKYKSIV